MSHGSTRKTASRRWALLLGAGLTVVACSNPDVTLLNQSFLNLFTGADVPIAPGPDTGFVEVLVMNSTAQSVEFIVTAEQEENIVNLDGAGNVISFDPARVLEPKTVNLLTDVNAPTLAIVFDHSPVEFPPVGPGQLTDFQSLVDQLAAKDPELVQDRTTIRLVRVLRIGLGPDLGVPSGQDNGIVVRPSGSNPDTNAGSIFPSSVNNVLSYDVGTDPADFGNGDIVIFLSTTSASAVGGVGVIAGYISWEEANSGNESFNRDTFEVLRSVAGPISPSTDG